MRANINQMSAWAIAVVVSGIVFAVGVSMAMKVANYTHHKESESLHVAKEGYVEEFVESSKAEEEPKKETPDPQEFEEGEVLKPE